MPLQPESVDFSLLDFTTAVTYLPIQMRLLQFATISFTCRFVVSVDDVINLIAFHQTRRGHKPRRINFS